MVSVTQRINSIKQPRGGYVKPKEFTVTSLDDNVELNTDENIHSSLVGLAVDYLTRFMMGKPLNEAFYISLLGAARIREENYAKKILNKISGLDDTSIINACKLVGYDVCVRAGITRYQPVQRIVPDSSTIFNILTMVNRSIKFMKQYGPIVKEGFTFEGGYTQLVSTGDGDFLTENTIWDFKISNKGPSNAHTLQLLMYYIMGKHSIHHEEFNNIKNLGIFNPRLNNVYMLEISSIAPNVIEEVSLKVIGY